MSYYLLPTCNLSRMGEPSLEPPCSAPIFCPDCDKEAHKLDNIQIECYNCDKIYELEPYDDERYA